MNFSLLLAQVADGRAWFERVLEPDVLIMLVPIVFLVLAFGYKMTQSIIVHRERMAKIEQGIDPDAVQTPQQKPQ